MSEGSAQAVVRYEVSTNRQSVRSISNGSGLDFEVEGLQTTLDTRALTVTGSTLQYGANGVGQLTGQLALQSGETQVVSDFGDGMSYPEERWRCW
jgi:hypothetical protein